VGRRVLNGFYARRSADLEILLEPYWIFSQSGASHGTTFSYDTHVPLIFMGAGIRPGRYYQSVFVNDVAPTLAAILDVETPSGSVGRVLSEMFGD
jgi:arylsulfatase A-like enzyme